MASVERLGGGRVSVRFSDLEMETFRSIARRRNRRNDGRNRRAEEYRLDGDEAHLIGVVGEAAFCAYRGLPYSEIKVLDREGDDGIDFDLPEGSVQVKCTRRQQGPVLTVARREHKVADYFVASIFYPRRRSVDLVGAVSTRALVKRFDEQAFGDAGHPTRVLYESDLARLKEPDVDPQPLYPKPTPRLPSEGSFPSGDDPTSSHAPSRIRGALEEISKMGRGEKRGEKPAGEKEPARTRGCPPAGPAMNEWFSQQLDEPEFAEFFT